MSAVRAFARPIRVGTILLAVLPLPAQITSTFTKPLSKAAAVSGEAATPTTLRDVFGDTAAERSLEQSLAPYLTAVTAENNSLLRPVSSDGARRTFAVGSSLIVMASSPAYENVPVTLPEGHWVNFWTGAQSMGGAPFTVELPAGALPIWARGGSVIERRSGGYDGYFERRLSGQAQTCGADCLFDLMPAFTLSGHASIQDADGRTITRSHDALAVQGKPGHMTVRWRFTRVTNVRLNGIPVAVQSSPEGYYTSFDHTDMSVVEWTTREYVPHAY